MCESCSPSRKGLDRLYSDKPQLDLRTCSMLGCRQGRLAAQDACPLGCTVHVVAPIAASCTQAIQVKSTGNVCSSDACRDSRHGHSFQGAYEVHDVYVSVAPLHVGLNTAAPQPGILYLTLASAQEHKGKGPFLAHSGCTAAATAVLAALHKDGTLPGILQQLAKAAGKRPAGAHQAEEPGASVDGGGEVSSALARGSSGCGMLDGCCQKQVGHGAGGADMASNSRKDYV